MKPHTFEPGRRAPWCVHTETQPGDGGVRVCARPESDPLHATHSSVSSVAGAASAANGRGGLSRRPQEATQSAVGRPLARQWASYREVVVPADAPLVQVRECQRAFFAGAHALFNLVHRGLSENDEPTPEDIAFMDAIAAELQEFALAQLESGDKPR